MNKRVIEHQIQKWNAILTFSSPPPSSPYNQLSSSAIVGQRVPITATAPQIRLDHECANKLNTILKPDQIAGWVFKMPLFFAALHFSSSSPPKCVTMRNNCCKGRVHYGSAPHSEHYWQLSLHSSGGGSLKSSQRCFYASVLLASEGFILFSGETLASPSSFSWKLLLLRNLIKWINSWNYFSKLTLTLSSSSPSPFSLSVFNWFILISYS